MMIQKVILAMLAIMIIEVLVMVIVIKVMNGDMLYSFKLF